jgi:hypothetical protein
MAIDWGNQERVDVIRAYAIQPTNLDYTRYEMGGLVLAGSSISSAYYSDTRVSGKLTISDADGAKGWDRNSFVRIVHEVPGAGYRRELGTFLVSDDGGSYTGGEGTRDLTLQSGLYALKNDILRKQVVVKRGTRWQTVISDILREVHRPYVISSTDRRCGADVTYETSKGRLDALLAMCSAAGYRADVDPHGRVTIKDYRLPVQREGSFTLDMTSKTGIVHDGLGYSSDWISRPSVAITETTWTDQVDLGERDEKGHKKNTTVYSDLIGHARITSGYNSLDVRGYDVTAYKSIQDDQHHRSYPYMDGEAAKMLSSDQWEDTEFSVTTQYLPIWAGDVGTLVLPKGLRVFDSIYGGTYSGQVRVLVKSCDLTLDTMQLKLTLKVVNAKDSDGSD